MNNWDPWGLKVVTSLNNATVWQEWFGAENLSFKVHLGNHPDEMIEVGFVDGAAAQRAAKTSYDFFVAKGWQDKLPYHSRLWQAINSDAAISFYTFNGLPRPQLPTPVPQKSYLDQSLDQLIYGNYTEDVTLLGTGGQIVTGLVGIDLPGDIRDITYDLSHWEWSLAHGRQTALDTIGLFPLVGALKYSDEAAALLKHSDELVLDTTKAGTKVIKHADEASSVVQNSLRRLVGEKQLWHFEQHHIFFKSLGGSDEAANLLSIRAYLHRGAGIGLHQHLAKTMGNYDEMKKAWKGTKNLAQKRAFISKLREAYSSYFKSAPDYDEIMKLIDAGLDTAK